MARLWIFDGMTEELVTTASNDPNASTMRFFDAPYREMLNDEITFEFAVNGAHEDAVHVVENNIVAFTDNEGDLQAFRIVEIEEVHESDGAITKYAHCEHMAYEMLHDIVEDRRIVDGELDVALSAALSASRWEVGRTDSLGVATINFYYANGLNNVRNVAAAYGGEVKFRVEATGGKLTGFYVDVLARRGADTGNRFTYTKDITEIRRIVDTTGIKTALYGRGASEEIEETGGHTRKPDFGDVVWSVSNGDPVDKPAGQKWVGDDDARNMYGFNGGQRHRFGVVEFDTTDTAELLALTWQRLQELKTPRATYEMSVLRLGEVSGLSHEDVSIGDTVFVIDRDLGIRAEARVVELEIDEANPKEGTVILGNFIPLFTDYDAELEAVKRTVQDKEAIWDEGGDPPEREVDDEDFPDTKPPTPENVRAEGLFRSISVEWDYDPATYIAAYEVFASQVPDFPIDSSNRVYRGKVGGYVHNADVNQTWYFRVRAINTHGTPSDLSEEVSATTLRVQENDIEEEYRQGIVDEAKGYTDAERDAILEDMADKADLSYVDGRLETKADADVVDGIIADVADKADLTYVNNQLQTKADAEDTYTKIEVDNALNGYVSVTEYETDQEGIVTQLSDHESRIEQTETDIEARVTRTEYNQKIGDIEGDITSIETTVNNHSTAISQNADDIELKANAEDVYTKQQVDSSLGDKADKSEVNAIETRVESAEATLSVHADRIDSKVEQVVYDADMDGVITRLDTAESNISQQADEIESRVTYTEFNAVDDRLSTAESTITQHADEIEARVEKDGVISAINLTSEEAKIDAQRITLEGDVYMEGGLVRIGGAVIDDVHIKDRAITSELIADDVITDRMIASNAQIDFAKIANVEITDAQIANISADKIVGGSFEGQTFTGGLFNGSTFMSLKEYEETGDYDDPLNTSSTLESGIINNHADFSDGARDVFIRHGMIEIAGIGGGFDTEGYTEISPNLIRVGDSYIPDEVRIEGSLIELVDGRMGSVARIQYNGFTTSTGFNLTAERINIVGDNGFSFRSWGAGGASILSSRELIFDSGIIQNLGTTYFGEEVRIPNASGYDGSNGITGGLSIGNYIQPHKISDNGGDLTVYGNRGTGRPFVVRSHYSPSNVASSFRDDLWVGDDGNLYNPEAYNATTSSSANVRIGTGTYRFLRATSARKYKTEFRKVEEDIDPYALLDLELYSWVDKGDVERNNGSLEGLQRHYGFIADDLEKVGLSQYVDYHDGEVEHYHERVWSLLIPIVRDHEEVIEKLQSRIKTLEEALAGK